jgi:hypothetical protein
MSNSERATFSGNVDETYNALGGSSHPVKNTNTLSAMLSGGVTGPDNPSDMTSSASRVANRRVCALCLEFPPQISDEPVFFSLGEALKQLSGASVIWRHVHLP